MNQTCVPREKLLQYFQGWADEDSSQHIESHLQHCLECESQLEQIEKQQRPIEFAGVGLEQIDLVNVSKESAWEADEELPADLGDVVRAISSWDAANWDAGGIGLPHSEIGNYQLIELIGRGGMAEVYRAKQKKLQRDVAIKVLHVPRTKVDESLQRIEREMAAIGRLNHPGIVSAIDTGEINGNPFLVTEFIDGLDVSRLSRIQGPLEQADACEIVRQAAVALANAHGQGIIHRDLKPSNLMIDKSGSVKILDFGLAYLEDESQSVVELTTVGQLLGTLDYMAPEQAEQASQVDHRSDVYSLGATLFRLLSGRAPYAATTRQSALEKMRLLATTQPPRISTLRQGLDNGLSKLVDSTLARSPDQRPASAAHLAEALESFCDEADLSALVNTALEKREHMAEDPIEPSLLLSSSQLAAQSSGGGGWGRWPVLLGFAGMFAALCLGIVITLDTMKGQVVIQTDAADVKVHLLKDGKQYKELEIQPGTNSTRLFAGQYEIQIDAGTDRYVIDKNNFQLKSGETVVATVSVQDAKPQDAKLLTSPDANVPRPENDELRRMWIEYLAAESSRENDEAARVMRSLVLMDRTEEIRPLIMEAIEMLNQRPDTVMGRNLTTAVKEFGLDANQTQLVLEKAFQSEARDYYQESISPLVDYAKRHPAVGLQKQISEIMWSEIESNLANQARDSVVHALQVMEPLLSDGDHPEYLKQVYDHPQLGLLALLEADVLWPITNVDSREKLLENLLRILEQDHLDLKLETSATRLLVTLCTEEQRGSYGQFWLWRKDLPAELSVEIEDTLSKIAEGILGTKEMYAFVEGGIVYTPVDLQGDWFITHLASRFTGLPSGVVRQRFQLLLYLIKSAGDATHPHQPNPIFAKVAELEVDWDVVQLLGKIHNFRLVCKMAENGRYYPETGIVNENDATVVLDRETVSPLFIQRVAANILKGYSKDGEVVEAEGSDTGPAVEQLLANLKSAQTVEELGAAARAINLADAQDEAQEVLTQRIIESIRSKTEATRNTMSEVDRYVVTQLISATGVPLQEEGVAKVVKATLEYPSAIGYGVIAMVVQQSDLRKIVCESTWEFLDHATELSNDQQQFVHQFLLYQLDATGSRNRSDLVKLDQTEQEQLRRYFADERLGLASYLKWTGGLGVKTVLEYVDRRQLFQQAISILKNHETSRAVEWRLLTFLKPLCLKSDKVPYSLNVVEVVWDYRHELKQDDELSKQFLAVLKSKIERELEMWLIRHITTDESWSLSAPNEHWRCEYEKGGNTMLLGEYLLFLTDRIEQSVGDLQTSETVRSVIHSRTKDAYEQLVKQLGEAGDKQLKNVVVRVTDRRGRTEEDWMSTQVYSGEDGRYRFESNHKAALAVLHWVSKEE